MLDMTLIKGAIQYNFRETETGKIKIKVTNYNEVTCNNWLISPMEALKKVADLLEEGYEI